MSLKWVKRRWFCGKRGRNGGEESWKKKSHGLMRSMSDYMTFWVTQVGEHVRPRASVAPASVCVSNTD